MQSFAENDTIVGIQVDALLALARASAIDESVVSDLDAKKIFSWRTSTAVVATAVVAKHRLIEDALTVLQHFIRPRVSIV